MTRLLFVVLDDLTCMPALLKAWRDIGVPGVTILENVGAHRARTWLSLVGLDNIDRLFEAKEVQRRTLLAAIDDEPILDQAIAEAERVVGGFDRPNSGLLLVLPALESRGLHKAVKPIEEPVPPAVRSDWELLRNTPVEKMAEILGLDPTVVAADTPLADVAQAMLSHPNVHVACVVSQDGHLVGLLNLRSLAEHLFFRILPEEFFSEITDLEHVSAFAGETRSRTAADAMQKPAWVKPGETAREAFKRMRENDLSGLPVVNNRHEVIGYINMLELLAICLNPGETANRSEGE